VEGPNGIASLTAGLDQASVANYVDVHSALQADGTLVLDNATIQSIAGGNLGPGSHTLHVLASDQTGASQSIDLNFAVITPDQAIALLAYLAGPASSNVRTAAGTEIAALITASSVTAAQAMTDIFNTTDVLNIAQAVAVMMYTAAHGSAGVQSAANAEI